MTSFLYTPRYQTANAEVPGDRRFWQTMLDQSDVFSFDTARSGKGGPFGAQLWLYSKSKDEYVLVGTAERPEDSNAVVSKGIASAHAEAENLSPENREKVVRFLETRRGEDWQVVQVSSGESCQSCRAKQVLFAQELIDRKLIARESFTVVFKATYQQTKRDAQFNDAPYDMAFRAINHLRVLHMPQGMLKLDSLLRNSTDTRRLVQANEIIYNPVNADSLGNLPVKIRSIFEQSANAPLAVIVTRGRERILASSGDERSKDDPINLPEKTAIVAALHKAAVAKRAAGVFESWNLQGAELITNIEDIGPQAYAETLWYNLSGITVIPAGQGYSGGEIDLRARELSTMSNTHMFRRVAGEYNKEPSPIRVTFMGNEADANAAHLYWASNIERERILKLQGQRIAGLSDVKVSYIDGSDLKLSGLVQHSSQSSHYDGKQAPSDPANE